MAADTNKPDGRLQAGEQAMPVQSTATATGGKPGDSLSMHADVPVWCDCCSCEAEPYWVEAFRESDENVGSDS